MSSEEVPDAASAEGPDVDEQAADASVPQVKFNNKFMSIPDALAQVRGLKNKNKDIKSSS
jgi:hypothetical protein